MPDFTTIIRNGAIVTADGIRRGDVGIVGSKIAAVAENFSGSAAQEIDATGRHTTRGVLVADPSVNGAGR